MTTPIVTELSRTLDPTTTDPFIDRAPSRLVPTPWVGAPPLPRSPQSKRATSPDHQAARAARTGSVDQGPGASAGASHPAFPCHSVSRGYLISIPVPKWRTP